MIFIKQFFHFIFPPSSAESLLHKLNTVNKTAMAEIHEEYHRYKIIGTLT